MLPLVKTVDLLCIVSYVSYQVGAVLLL